MTNEEKALELAEDNVRVYKDSEYDYTFYAIRDACVEMAEWKDSQNKWHKVADGDLPKESGNYWCKLKGNYVQGSSHYKQHCNDGYCILQWLVNKQKWNVRYKTEVEAWIELPRYIDGKL